MIWDARVWSFFIWIIAFAMFLCGFVTPYDMPGNLENIRVAFGGSVDPELPKYGLWGEVPEELVGSFMAVRVILSIGAALIFVSFIFYILLFRRNHTVIQITACVINILAGVLILIGIGIYRAASGAMGEGFWFVMSSGGLLVVNGIILIMIPWMEYQAPRWKLEKTEAAVPLTRQA